MLGMPALSLKIGLFLIVSSALFWLTFTIMKRPKEARFAKLTTLAAAAIFVLYAFLEQQIGIGRMSAFYTGIGVAVAIGLAWGYALNRWK